MTYASQTLRTKWPELVESSPLDTVGVRSVAGWLKQVSLMENFTFIIVNFLLMSVIAINLP